jgi:hypothetical protein
LAGVAEPAGIAEVAGAPEVAGVAVVVVLVVLGSPAGLSPPPHATASAETAQRTKNFFMIDASRAGFFPRFRPTRQEKGAVDAEHRSR